MSDTEWFSGRGADDPPPCEQRYAPHRFAAVLFVVGLVLALLLGCASAAVPAVEIPVHVYDDGKGTVIKLMPGPCVHPEVKGFIGATKPELAARFRAIESTWRMRDGSMKDFAGCWIAFTAKEAWQPSFGLLFEDGDRHLIPRDEFLRRKGADT